MTHAADHPTPHDDFDFGPSPAQHQPPAAAARAAALSTAPLPPQAIEAEQSVLGAIMLDNARLPKIAAMLSESDFYNRRHRVIWRALTELNELGSAIDAVTVASHLEAQSGPDNPDNLGITSYIIDITRHVPFADNVESYATQVREASLLRAIIEAGADITTAGFRPDGRSAIDVYTHAITKLSGVAERMTVGTLPPVDLFAQAAPPALRPEWLPPAIAEFVFACSKVKGSPPEVLALSSLITCAAAAHDTFRVQPRPNEPGWTESARLWGMVIGDPSAMKSPPMRLAMSPLSDLNVRFVDAYRKAIAKYATDLEEHKAAEKVRVRAAAKGEGDADPTPLPERPRSERIIVNDATIEKLADLLSDNPRGMLYVNDELAGWFASMDAYSKSGTSGRDRSYWLRFYDGGRLIIDRISRETTVVDNASMCVLGAIQPERIRALSARMDDDGLLQRFIITIIPTAKRFPSNEPEPVHLIRQYDTIVRQIFATSPSDGPAIVKMDPEAHTVQEALMADVRSLVGTEGLPPMLRSHLAKWPGLFPRLCLTYHIIGCAAARKYPTAFAITGATAQRVAAMMRGWLLPSAITFYTGLMGNTNPAFDLARQIGDMILGRKMARVSNRDLTMSLHAWRAAPEWRQRAALTSLEQAGWLLPKTRDENERKGHWPVNPRVHVDFAARAAKVQTERAKVNEILLTARGAQQADSPDENDDGAAE